MSAANSSSSSINNNNNSNDEVTKLQGRLSLLREEYIRLQKRCTKAEQECSVLKATTAVSNGQGSSQDSSLSFVAKLLTTTANLYNNKKYSDVTIKLAETHVFGHKFILSIRNESWGKEGVGLLDWSDASQEVGEAVAKWAYTNHVDFDQGRSHAAAAASASKDSFALALMRKAKEFGLADLMDVCQESLLASVQVHNSILYYTTAEEIGAQVLKDHCSKLISNHWHDFNSEDFSHMTAPLLYSMFKSKTKYPLHSAIKLEREDVVFLYLIEFSSSLQSKLNEEDDRGNLPLDLALKSGQEEMAQNLVEHKCNVNQLDAAGNTLLHKAIQRGDEFSALFLLRHGADANACNWSDGNAPLHLVCAQSAMDNVAAKLLKLGAKPNAQNKALDTPLHLCIQHENVKVFELVLESSKLHLDPKNSDGLPPLWLALKNVHRGQNFVTMATGLVDNGATLDIICDDNNNTLLHMCASNGLNEAAQFVISKGANCDVINANGDTPLHSAAKGGLKEVAQTLQLKGADPNVQSYVTSLSEGTLRGGSGGVASRLTPMHIAVMRRDLEFVKAMLTSNVKGSGHRVPLNLHLKNTEGKTALALALEDKEFNIASELLKGGANVNDADADGRTLLHTSVQNNDLETTKFLLESGADLNLKDNENQTPLEIAIRGQRGDIVEELCKFGSDMSLSSTSDPPLWIALDKNDEDKEAGDEDIPAILVRHGVNTDVWMEGPDGCQQTLLHRAIDENKNEAACFLVRAGCDVNSVRKPGANGQGGEEAHDMATPLHLCCQWGLEPVVEALLEHGAMLNAKDVEGKTPLHMAVESGNQTIVNKLLDQKGLDLKSCDKMGLSAFACAMTFKNQRAAQRILQLEPSAADQLDSKGRNFLHTAILKDDLESVLFLLSVHANVHSKTTDSNKLSPLLLAVTKGSEMILRNLLLAGASVTDVNAAGQTGLQIAAESGLADICSVLLSNGVDFGAVDSRGNSALHVAVKEGHVDVVRALLTESSIDAEAANLKGRNPLHVLANFGKQTSVEIFNLFLECMPNYPINRPDADGNTPLLLAYMKGNGGLCRALISGGAVLGSLNAQGISLFNCQVASKQLLFKLLDFLSAEPKWGEGEVCEECTAKFGVTNRKHHCRHCGRLLCKKCSNKEMPIIKYKLSKPVRVCATCSDVLTIGVPPS